MLFTVQLWTRLGQSMRPASQQWSPFRLNSRSGARGISTNVALSKGGLLRYNVVYQPVNTFKGMGITHWVIGGLPRGNGETNKREDGLHVCDSVR